MRYRALINAIERIYNALTRKPIHSAFCRIATRLLKGEVFIVHMFRTLTSAVASIRSLVTSPLHSGYVIEYTRTYTN